MSRKGSALVVILFIVAVILVVGGIWHSESRSLYPLQKVVQSNQSRASTTVPLTTPNATSGDSNANGSGGDVKSLSGSGQVDLSPSGVRKTTVHLYSDEDSTANGLELKVNSITANQLNVTVTDHTTGESQNISLTPNKSMIAAGHDIILTSISQVSEGTVGGKPIYGEQAIVMYK